MLSLGMSFYVEGSVFDRSRLVRDWSHACLMNFAITLSDSPFEYALAVSTVLIPLSHAAFRSSRAYILGQLVARRPNRA